MRTRLSVVQRQLLTWLYQQHGQGRSWGVWGVPYRLTQNLTRTQQASRSRALKRLELRGLIQRTNHVSGPAPNEYIRKHRTTHIVILPLHEALALGTLNRRITVLFRSCTPFAERYPTKKETCNAVASYPTWHRMVHEGLVEKKRAPKPRTTNVVRAKTFWGCVRFDNTGGGMTMLRLRPPRTRHQRRAAFCQKSIGGLKPA